MKNLIKIVFLVLTFNLYSQFDYIEGHYYERPGEYVKQCVDIEYIDKQFQTFERGEICRETVWKKEYHQGTIWVPINTDGTWRAIRNQCGYYWKYNWSDWKFKKKS